MILERPNIDDEAPFSTAANSISQLIIYNAIKHQKDGTTTRPGHEQETSLPVYVGMKIYSQTKSKAFIDKMHDCGLSIPYKRVMTISTSLAKSM